MERITAPQIEEIMQLSTLTLATSDNDGIPHATPVYFVAIHPTENPHQKSLRLYFFSEEKSLHIQQTRANSHAAAAIYPECFGWQDIRGIQMHGTVKEVPAGAEWDHAWEAYREKFPFVKGLKLIVTQNKLYVFTPSWLRLVDNRVKFGFKKEWRLELDGEELIPQFQMVSKK